MLQQTPRTVTAEPASEVTVPPDFAVVFVIAVTSLVVTTGTADVGVSVGVLVFAQPSISVIDKAAKYM
ncbi:MAG: hypothetical protein WCX28_08930 [Bacteriovoracaceae bacterium]|nr:hypothetical protein [Bacteroidota bacterium]